MTTDKIEEIRAQHEAEEFDSAVDDREWLLGEVERLRAENDHARKSHAAYEKLSEETEKRLEAAIERLIRERDEARAEVERQAQHIEALQSKIDAAKSCACSFEEYGDVCSVHSPAVVQARAEVERLRKALTAIAKVPRSDAAYGVIQCLVDDALDGGR